MTSDFLKGLFPKQSRAQPETPHTEEMMNNTFKFLKENYSQPRFYTKSFPDMLGLEKFTHHQLLPLEIAVESKTKERNGKRGLRMQKRGSPTWGKTSGSPGWCRWEISRQCVFSGFEGSHTFNLMKQPESISKKVKETGNRSRHQMQNSGIQIKRREIPWMTMMGSPE